MIDIDNWMRELEEEEDIEIKNNEEYQTKLFEEYVLRGSDHQEERRKLNERYLSGEELMGEHGLRKELAAFDMSYFGRAYLPHYFIRKSPHFHEELDEIWSRGVMKGRNPLKEAKVISRLKGSRQVVAAPRGHAKSTNFTFKDSLHAILYAYKHYILILSDSSEQSYQRRSIQSCGMSGKAYIPTSSMRTMRRMQGLSMKPIRKRCSLELKSFGKRSCPTMT